MAAEEAAKKSGRKVPRRAARSNKSGDLEHVPAERVEKRETVTLERWCSRKPCGNPSGAGPDNSAEQRAAAVAPSRVRAGGWGVTGSSGGVGFVMCDGLAVSAITPVGAAWRKLQSKPKVAAVKWPSRTDLPRGMVLITVYAPGSH